MAASICMKQIEIQWNGIIENLELGNIANQNTHTYIWMHQSCFRNWRMMKLTLSILRAYNKLNNSNNNRDKSTEKI